MPRLFSLTVIKYYVHVRIEQNDERLEFEKDIAVLFSFNSHVLYRNYLKTSTLI